MAWERRSRGGLYYVRKRRVGSRVICEYVGTGPVAAHVAELDAEDRAEREHQRRALHADIERWETLDAAIAELCGGTDALARATLLVAGYRQHHRGEWRKRRGA